MITSFTSSVDLNIPRVINKLLTIISTNQKNPVWILNNDRRRQRGQQLSIKNLNQDKDLI